MAYGIWRSEVLQNKGFKKLKAVRIAKERA
jgi:hypothetical protein